MRTLSALAASTLALASLAGAAAAQDDRYGPPPAWLERTTTPAPYKGPFLSWTGKSAPAPNRPTSMPPAPPMSSVYAPQPAPAHRFARPTQAYAPPAQSYAPAAQSYAPPPVAYAPPPSYMQPPPQAAAPAPQAPAAAQPQPTPTTQATAGASHVRFYSLHRAYGLEPDPDPKPTGNPLVLIAPPQSAHDDSDASDDSGDGAKHADAQNGAS